MKHSVFEWRGDASGMSIAIVVSRFNSAITDKLLEGALGALKGNGLPEANVRVVWVPGAFELPLAAQALACGKGYDAIICLGVVIRGETDHYEYVCSSAVRGIAQVGLSTGVPVIFGVITTDNVEQALERAGGCHGNKGADSALAAMEMALLMKELLSDNDSRKIMS